MAQAWRAQNGLVVPGAGSTRWLGFRYLAIDDGQTSLTDAPAGAEAAVVLVAGEVEVERGGSRFLLGPRPDPFDHLPEAAYLPRGEAVTVTSRGPAAVALAWAEGDPSQAPYRVGAGEIALETRGAGPAERTIRHLLEGDRPAHRLYLVEVITPAAHWSSFPPHRHDRHAPPDEYAMEEAYLFRVDPPEHRALMGTWSDELSDAEAAAFLAADGDLIMVHAGYHTVSAAPGSRLYYLNAMAGPERTWKPVFHPRYLHLVEGWGNAPVAAAGEPVR
jgi:5-deoxy-glucuronate isomerase